MEIILKRIAIIVVLWAMLTGGAVFICSSGGDGNLLVPGRNRPPVAEDSFLQTQVETSITSTMQASDPDGDDLTYRVTAGPDAGSLSNINADTGRFTYLPAALGTDRFTFKANDGRLDSDNGTVSILVTEQTVGTQIVGLESALPDVSRAGGLTVLWASPSGIVERIPEGAGPTQSLLHGVEKLVVDPWQSGRLLAYTKEGRLLTSADGGLGWQPAGRLQVPTDVGALAYAGNRVLITIDDADCVPQVAQGLFIPVAGDASPIDVDLSCGHDPVLGSLDGAYFIRDGWLHSIVDDEKLLGPGVVAVTTDHWRQKRIVAMAKDESGRLLMRLSEDGGQSWRKTSRADLPQSVARGEIGRLIFDLEKDGLMFVSVWNGDGTTSVFRSRSEQGAWDFVGSLSDGKAKLTRCAYDAVCLLSDDGTRMNRFPDTLDEG
jgi:hypothetical protein